MVVIDFFPDHETIPWVSAGFPGKIERMTIDLKPLGATVAKENQKFQRETAIAKAFQN